MERKYQIDTNENLIFLSDVRENLLSFGHRFPSPGGSSYWLGDDGTPWKDRNRETWITSRMAHVYSLGVFLGHNGSRELEEAAVNGLCGELHDSRNGGWYPGVKPDGEIMPDKQCYSHAFVCLAASSALLAGNNKAKDLLHSALFTYDSKFWDEEKGLAVDTWNTEFTRLDSYRGLNANMHSVEAFLAIADSTGDENYRVRAGSIINHVIKWASENNWRIPEHYTSDWTPDLEKNSDRPDDQFKPYGATPGHGIEWARLITQWALSTFGRNQDIESPETDKEMKTDSVHNNTHNSGSDNRNDTAETNGEIRKYVDAAEKLYRRAVSDGWYADGHPGIVYTTDWNGRPVVHDRMHWTLAEAINTSSVLYRVTGKGQYADHYAAFMEYLDEYVIDHVNGSWFHQLDRYNHVKTTVWPGKSDLYHAVQATLIPFYSPAVSIASAVLKGLK